MKPVIDEKLIKHLTLLSRLETSPEEKKSLLGHLTQVLEYFEKLKEVNTNQVEPLVHTRQMQNVFREDKPKEGLAQEDALANAPDKESGHFKVPRVI